MPILVDQGQADDFLEAQLKPDLLQQASERSAAELELRLHEGYHHSYFFISSFIEQHLRFHTKYLRNRWQVVGTYHIYLSGG